MTRNMYFRLALTITLSIMACVGTTFAQSAVNGAISGKIADPQGSVVPNATVTITNIGTNSATTVTTSDDGVYKVTNLAPGTYRVETSVTGFGPAKGDVIVEVGKTTTMDISLVLGTATAEVNVTAE